MLEKILNSEVKVKILKLLVDRPKWIFTESEISREISVPKTTTHRALKKLRDQNIIREFKKAGRVVIFQLNKDNYVVRELIEPIIESDNKIIFKKTKEFCKELKKYFDVAILFGSVIKGQIEPTSDIDIALITKDIGKLDHEIEKLKLKYLEDDELIVSTKIFGIKEFKKRYEKNDPLIKEILLGKIIFGNLEEVV